MSVPLESPGPVPGTLVFGWGNPLRGDDALGPLLIERVEALTLAGVECLTDFQLQVENVLDLRGRRRVLFVDASASARPPFEVSRLECAKDDSYTTHELSPEAVLDTYRSVLGGEPPPAWLLAIRGDSWELGDAPSADAMSRLDLALEWAITWLTG